VPDSDAITCPVANYIIKEPSNYPVNVTAAAAESYKDDILHIVTVHLAGALESHFGHYYKVFGKLKTATATKTSKCLFV